MLLCTLLSDFHPHLPLNASVGLALDERPRFSLLERPPLLRYYIYSEMQKWGLALTNELESTESGPFQTYQKSSATGAVLTMSDASDPTFCVIRYFI